jgi:hypothetical protein
MEIEMQKYVESRRTGGSTGRQKNTQRNRNVHFDPVFRIRIQSCKAVSGSGSGSRRAKMAQKNRKS